jgi:hypothetical protein
MRISDIIKLLYSSVDTLLWGYLQQAYNYERFGNEKDEIYYNYINDFYYLFITLSMILEEEKQYEAQSLLANGCISKHSYDYYKDKYNLSCIYRYMRCHKINIESHIESIIKNIILLDGGIGGMYIETVPTDNCQTYNIFKIS